MADLLSALNGAAVSLYGGILAAAFATGFKERKQRWGFACGMAVLLLLQVVLALLLGTDSLTLIYPLAMHIPLVLLLILMKGDPVWSAVSVLNAYLCCEIRRWIALLITALLSGGETVRQLLELCVTLPLLLPLLFLVAPAVREMGSSPLRSRLFFAIVPAVYYIFDLAAVVYTTWFLSGNLLAVEFMSFVCSVAFPAYILYHTRQERKRQELLQLNQCMDLQLEQSMREVRALRNSQEQAKRYRHDLRHHLQFISACIENGNQEKALDYMREIDSSICGQAVTRYCENEAMNLILSAYAERAVERKVSFRVQGALEPNVISEESLCVLLSNALENALNEAATHTGGDVDVRFYRRERTFFLQITNPCRTVEFKDGLPVSHRAGHGIGVKSICAVVKRHGGVCSFSVQEGRFILRVSFVI